MIPVPFAVVKDFSHIITGAPGTLELHWKTEQLYTGTQSAKVSTKLLDN